MSEVTVEAPPIRTTTVAHRIVQLGLFLTLVWKLSYFQTSLGVYITIPLDDPFFPDWLRSPYTIALAFLITVAVIGLSFFTASRPLQRQCAWITIVGTTILCIHQGSYNDMTFVTAWWVSLWSLWYVHQDWERDPESLLQKAAFLSRVIISMILLGGAIGKWTGEYWSGEVLHDIYFRDRDYWLFNVLRSIFEPETLREIATWYSRKVIVLETVTGFGLWLLPPRWAAIAGVVLLTSIALFSNFFLFSVLWCLIGLASIGLLVPWKQPPESGER